MSGKTNKKKKLSKLFWKITVSSIGVVLILIAVSNLMLYFFGETASCSVTTRRIGGSDDNRPPDQRYEWSLDYTFQDKNGFMHSGHTTRRSNDFSVNTDNKVYYFPSAPFISALQSEAEPNSSQFMLITIGLFLIFVMNRKKKNLSPDSEKKRLQELDDYDDSVEELFHNERE